MNNPHLKELLAKYPGVEVSALTWPKEPDPNTWTQRDLEMFISSNGFIKPKKKKAPAPANAAPDAPPAQKLESQAKPEAAPQVPVASEVAQETHSKTQQESFGAQEASKTPQYAPAARVVSGAGLQEKESAFEKPGFSVERHALTLPVRVHCEDTTPKNHVRLESLVAFAERLRSLGLKQEMGVTLADLQKQKAAILATEYVIEIVGDGCGVLETLRIDSTPEFPGAPVFPWDTKMFLENGNLYAQGLFCLNWCEILPTGGYGFMPQAGYDRFCRDMRKWSNPNKQRLTGLRLFTAFEESGRPFRPVGRREERYTVRESDCDLYSVLFQARVCSMVQTCFPKRETYAMYVYLGQAVNPWDELTVHVLYSEDPDAAVFFFLLGETVKFTAFAHFAPGARIRREEIKSARSYVQGFEKYFATGAKPPNCKDFDLSAL